MPPGSLTLRVLVRPFEYFIIDGDADGTYLAYASVLNDAIPAAMQMTQVGQQAM